MTEHPSLFDPVAAIEARDEAIGRVDRNADPVWKQQAQTIVRNLAHRLDELTTDDVWQALNCAGVDVPHEPRALGAVMQSAARQNVIAATDRVRQSQRPECHARPVRIWRSLVAA